MIDNFERQLVHGKAGESLISKWLMSSGWHVLPIYEKVETEFKGPTLFTSDGELIAPDLFCFHTKRGIVRWVEAKHKTAFSWYRKRSIWTTGIDSHHFSQYLKVRAIVDKPVYLLFLHQGGHAKDSPDISPSGLYGGEILKLEAMVNHVCQSNYKNNYGKGGMTYWDKDSLTKYATLEEVHSRM